MGQRKSFNRWLSKDLINTFVKMITDQIKRNYLGRLKLWRNWLYWLAKLWPKKYHWDIIKHIFFKILENIHTRLFLNSLVNIKKDQINELYPLQPKESINVYQRFLFFLPFFLSLLLSFYVVILFIPSHRRA